MYVVHCIFVYTACGAAHPYGCKPGRCLYVMQVAGGAACYFAFVVAQEVFGEFGGAIFLIYGACTFLVYPI